MRLSGKQWQPALMPRHEWKTLSEQQPFVDWEFMEGLNIRLPTDNVLSQEVVCADFEPADRRFVRAFLRPGDTFVDIGAHIGLYSLIASESVGKGGKVISFEPSAKTFSRLLENTKLYGHENVVCVRSALGDAPGHATLNAATDAFDLCNSFAHPSLGQSYVPEEVPTDTWDRYAAEHTIDHVTLMKVDVEGWEHLVCAGARKLLERPDAPVLLMEFNDAFASHTGVWRRDLYKQLQKWGYRIFTADASGMRLIPHDVLQEYACMNLIAAKNPLFVRFRLWKSRLIG
jgi:FkbM family methyltransferase